MQTAEHTTKPDHFLDGADFIGNGVDLLVSFDGYDCTYNTYEVDIEIWGTGKTLLKVRRFGRFRRICLFWKTLIGEDYETERITVTKAFDMLMQKKDKSAKEIEEALEKYRS